MKKIISNPNTNFILNSYLAGMNLNSFKTTCCYSPFVGALPADK